MRDEALIDEIDSLWEQANLRRFISRAMIKSGQQNDRVFELIDAISPTDTKLRALADAVEAYCFNGHQDQALQCIQKSKQVIEDYENKKYLLRELAYFASKLSSCDGLQDDTYYFVQNVEDYLSELEGNWQMSQAMGDIAIAYYYLGQPEKVLVSLSAALDQASEMTMREEYNDTDERMRADAYKNIVWRCIELGEIDYAYNILQRISFLEVRIEMLCELAFRIKATQSHRSDELLDEANQLCTQFESLFFKKHSLQYIALTHARLGHGEVAENIVDQLSNNNFDEERLVSELDHIRQKTLNIIVHVLAKHGALEQAYQFTQLDLTPYMKIRMLCIIAECGADTGYSEKILSEALVILDDIDDAESTRFERDEIMYVQRKVGLIKSSDQDLVSDAYRYFRWGQNPDYVKLKEIIDQLQTSVEKMIFLCHYVGSAKGIDSSTRQKHITLIDEILSQVLSDLNSTQKIIDLVSVAYSAELKFDFEDLLSRAFQLAQNIDDRKNRSNMFERITRLSLEVNIPSIAAKVMNDGKNILPEILVNIVSQIAVYYFKQGDIHMYGELLKQAKQITDQLDEQDQEPLGKALQAYCWALAMGHNRDLALNIARSITHQDSHDGAIHSVVYSMTIFGELTEALALVKEIHGESDRAWTLELVARKHLEKSNIDSAIEIIKLNEPTDFGINAVIRFAEDLYDSEHIDSARDLLHHALTWMKDMETSNRRASTSKYLLNTLARYQLFSEFFHTLRGSTVDIFVNVIAEQSDIFESEQPGLSIQILKESTRIASWIQPYWTQIYELLDSVQLEK